MSYTERASKFEKTFSTFATFNRNKKYIDLLKKSNEQARNEQKRRVPKILNQTQIVNHKIDNSFSNAKQQTRNQVHLEMDKYRFRNSPNRYQQEEEQQHRSPSKSPQKVKGFELQKNLSRQYLESNAHKNGQTSDQRQFNNFYITSNDLSRTPSIKKYSDRKLDFSLKHINDLIHNSNKVYNKINFDRNTEACTFHIKKQKDRKGRYFFTSRREEDNPAVDLDPEKVQKSFSNCSNFKGDKIMQFYRMEGRDLPSQYDQRFLSPNCNFFKDKHGRVLREGMDFTSRSYKDSLLSRDKDDRQVSKIPNFTRDEICDERFFRQEKRYGRS